MAMSVTNNLSFELDNDFKNIFKPFYIIDTLFCTRAYNISKNQVFPFTMRNLMLLILINVLLIASFYVAFSKNYFRDKTSEITFFFTYFMYIVVFTLSSILNVYHNKTELTLVSHLQMTQYIKNPEDTLKLKIMTWMSSLILVISCIFTIALKLFLHGTWFWTRFLFILTTIMLEMKLLHMSCMLHFLTYKIKKTTDIILSYRTCTHLGTPSQTVLNDLNSFFQILLFVYNLIKKSFQMTVSSFLYFKHINNISTDYNLLSCNFNLFYTIKTQNGYICLL